MLGVAFLLATPAKAEFGLHVGTHIEFGSMGTEIADAYESRSMGAFGLQAMPGYRLMGKSLLAGLMVDLRFHSQLSNGSANDYSGQSFLLGPAIALELAMFKLLLGWDLRARHSAKMDTSYSGSGFRFLLGYRLLGNMWADLHYVSMKYKTRSTAGIESDISSNPVKSGMVGVGLSWSF